MSSLLSLTGADVFTPDHVKQQSHWKTTLRRESGREREREREREKERERERERERESCSY